MTVPSTYKLGYPDLKYSVVPSFVYTRAPTSSDVYHPTAGGIFPLSTIWVVQGTTNAYILTSISSGSATWDAITDSAGGSVDGPGSATDKAIARFSSTTGKLIQNSVGVLSDLGILTGVRPTLPAGTAVAGTAPLKFTAGTVLGTPEAGAVEYDGTHFYYTNGAAVRKNLAPGPTASLDEAIAVYTGATGDLQNSTTTLDPVTGIMAMPAGANIGIGIAPTASLTIQAGTAVAGTAPIKLTTGVSLGAPEAGAIEYDGTHLYYTNGAAVRKSLAPGPTVSLDEAIAVYTGVDGDIQNSSTTLNPVTGIMTFPANGGVILTAGTRKGTVTLVGGAATVATAAANANSVIVFTVTALGTVTVPSAFSVTIDPGVDFDILASQATDTSTLTWAIVG